MSASGGQPPAPPGKHTSSGYITLRGRLKEIVKTGGINVAPVEVEEVLMPSGVHAISVTGVPDTVHDELPAPVIIPEPGVTLTAQDITYYCRQAFAAYKVPRLIRSFFTTGS